MTQVRKEWMRVSEAVKQYNLPRHRVYKAIRKGELPAADLGTAKRPSYLLSKKNIEAWLASLSTRRLN